MLNTMLFLQKVCLNEMEFIYDGVGYINILF